MNFTHLHIHSDYSILDGLPNVKQLAERVAELKMTAVALTDHGSISGAIQFYEACKNAGIDPILGCEFYTCNDIGTKDKNEKPNHLVLLAKNDIGWRNLTRLTSIASTEGFYGKPRIDFETLSQHCEGLICLTACIQGHIPRLIISGRLDDAAREIERYRELFGEDFYLEIMWHDMTGEFGEWQRKVNDYLIGYSRRNGVPIVATNDVHYLNEKDAAAHQVMLCLQTKTTLANPGMVYSSDQFYLKSPHEMAELFADVPEAIRNTLVIAGKCNLKLELGKPVLPIFHDCDNPTPETNFKTLEKIIGEGWGNRLWPYLSKNGLDVTYYFARLRQELETIRIHDYAGYFLMVNDYTGWAKKQGISMGLSRGSAGASLVLYALGVNDLDPILHDLPFSRFLTPGRKSLPDIDLDFCGSRRDEVFNYLIEKYGADKMVRIGNFTKLGLKPAVKGIGKVLGLSHSDTERIGKMIPEPDEDEDPIELLNRAIADNYELKAAFEQIPGYRHYVESLTGKIYHHSTHPGGVVISTEPLMDIAPVGRDKETGVPMIQLDHRDVEKMGLVKFDILSVPALDTIDNCVATIEQRHGVKIDWEAIGLEDETTYKLLATGNADGVFQFERYGAQELLRKIEVSNFNELCMASALNRPGPLRNKMDVSYIRRKFRLEKINYPHPLLEPVLKETLGIFIYQEEVMNAAKILAGYDDTEADDFRKAMGKKDKVKMEAQRNKFINGCLNNGISESDAEGIFSIMEKFAGYAFNKAHTVAYTILGYRMGYLKANYPLEFMAAAINAAMGNKDLYLKHIKDARRMGFSFILPDINDSDRGMAPVLDDQMLLGLRCVNKIGEKVVEELIEKRPFSGIEDFYKRIDKKIVHKGIVDNLIASGAFNKFGNNKLIKEAYYRLRKNNIPQENLPSETDIFGFHISRHPVEVARNRFHGRALSLIDLKSIPWEETQIIVMVKQIKVIQNKRGETMAFIKVEDQTGERDFVIFSNTYSQYGYQLKEGSIYWMNIEKSDRGSMIINYLEPIRVPVIS